jgi:hypothetical protein
MNKPTIEDILAVLLIFSTLGFIGTIIGAGIATFLK